MNNQMLPHEFFIYVSSAKDSNTVAHTCDCDATRGACTSCNQQPVDLSSWTRIDLAESVAVYARLQQDQQEQVCLS
jgi:predicted Fe-S protein YdhL (DUF1289 family)